MQIGLIDIEPKIFNTAYMQIGMYHKLRGDSVEWWSPLTDRQFDYVYCSSLFDYTDKSEVPQRTICGGTGFNVTSQLSTAIEQCSLDYGIYPKCKTTYLWFSRGCIRNCPWCVVPQKEGSIKSVTPKNLNPNGRYITVQDNNFFANPDWPAAIAWLGEQGWPVDFQGVDARLLNKKMCDAMLSLRHHKQIKIAWDDPRQDLEPKLKEIIRFIKPWRLMCYVLIGYWYGTEDTDLHRVETLRRLSIDPFVMPFDRRDLYQRAFARWVNHKGIFKTMSWQQYWNRVRQSESVGRGWKVK